MLDFDELDKQEKSTGAGALSRSASGASLVGEKPGGCELSRSGSASSLTSPVVKVPDGPSASKGGGLRLSQYQRQSQDLASSPKPLLKRDLDAAVEGVREEVRLLLAQQQLSLQQELRRSIEPVGEELKRVAAQASQQGGQSQGATESPWAEEVAALREKLARTSGALSLLTERVDQKHKALEDRIEDEMTEVTKGMTQLSEDLAEATGSIREELHCFARRLSEARDLPADLEGLRRDVAALQERSLARSLEGTMTPVSEASVMENGASEQEDVARAMAAVRKELLRAKDLFQSGQKSAGIVLTDVEILKQDLQALKESRPALGESSLEQLRSSLRQELADEFRALAEALIPRKAPA